ncbi:MAG: hypothetical protein KDJ76_00880 [Xanthobacteraceae bacterium]|nr:hypothetical protein [Xanthobacteraceae bacterium]
MIQKTGNLSLQKGRAQTKRQTAGPIRRKRIGPWRIAGDPLTPGFARGLVGPAADTAADRREILPENLAGESCNDAANMLEIMMNHIISIRPDRREAHPCQACSDS